MSLSDAETQRLADLKRKLATRKRAGTAYRESIPMIEAEIADLEAKRGS